LTGISTDIITGFSYFAYHGGCPQFREVIVHTVGNT
jgi:hypothetical protein